MRILRWLLIVVAIIVVVLAAGALVVNVIAGRQLAERIPAGPPVVLDVAHADTARGEHLAKVIAGCTGCHGADLGGKPFIDDPGFGHIYAPNLTRGNGGLGVRDDDAAFERAIRRGIGGDGHRLLIMPSTAYTAMTDDDTAAVIAYVRTMSPVDRPSSPVALGPVGKALIATGKLQFRSDQVAAMRREDLSAPEGPTPAYGRYLAHLSGCTSCHGPDLAGGHYEGGPNDPPAPNITPGGPVAKWTKTQFSSAVRAGVTPEGKTLNPFMPYSEFAGMTEDEIAAVYAYVKQVPPKKT